MVDNCLRPFWEPIHNQRQAIKQFRDEYLAHLQEDRETQFDKSIEQIFHDSKFAGTWNNNASDEINALLNYGYAILESKIRKCINSVGLDPAIGFLHEASPSKSSLVYDLQELFRWIIDLSVIQLLEENELKKSDFILTENYHIRLKENTAKLLIDKIRLNFNNKVPYKNKKNYAYQSILFDNIQKLAHFILEKDDRLIEFYVPKMTINKNDSLELRNKILDMTIGERKRLGIGKTTYWYMKKNIQDGKRIKIYDKVLSKLDRTKDQITS